MQVHVRLFASLREAAGEARIDLELPAPATPEDVWAQLVRRHPGLAARRRSLAAAVNRAYARFDAPLAPGDEVVFIPPVSGG